MKNTVIFILLAYLVYLGYQRFLKYPYHYVGYFYPSIDNMEMWIESDPFDSVDECRDWVDDEVDVYYSKYGVELNYDYECGEDCYLGDPYYQGVMYTCKTSIE